MQEIIDWSLVKHSTGPIIGQMYVELCSEFARNSLGIRLKTANRDLTFVLAQMATKSKKLGNT